MCKPTRALVHWYLLCFRVSYICIAFFNFLTTRPRSITTLFSARRRRLSSKTCIHCGMLCSPPIVQLPIQFINQSTNSIFHSREKLMSLSKRFSKNWLRDNNTSLICRLIKDRPQLVYFWSSAYCFSSMLGSENFILHSPSGRVYGKWRKLETTAVTVTFLYPHLSSTWDLRHLMQTLIPAFYCACHKMCL